MSDLFAGLSEEARERLEERSHPGWVRPDLVAQVRFTEWTDDGRLRHAVFLGLRRDKEPEEVGREAPGDGS